MIASPPSSGTDEIAALLGRWPGMSFFAAPTMVKRLASDRAIAEADLSHLKTIIYGGAPKRPRDYRFVGAVPAGNYGKVVRRELRGRLRAETADGGSR